LRGDEQRYAGTHQPAQQQPGQESRATSFGQHVVVLQLVQVFVAFVFVVVFRHGFLLLLVA
jgi:hypothetical protein